MLLSIEWVSWIFTTSNLLTASCFYLFSLSINLISSTDFASSLADCTFSFLWFSIKGLVSGKSFQGTCFTFISYIKSSFFPKFTKVFEDVSAEVVFFAKGRLAVVVLYLLRILLFPLLFKFFKFQGVSLIMLFIFLLRLILISPLKQSLIVTNAYLIETALVSCMPVYENTVNSFVTAQGFHVHLRCTLLSKDAFVAFSEWFSAGFVFLHFVNV